MTYNKQVQKNIQETSDFYSSVEVRSERLVTALYMVTNFFSDREPMKWKLRDAGLLLLSDAASLKDKNTSGKSETLVKLIYSIESIIALLDIARLADFISDMNYSVLNAQFFSLKKDVEKRAELRGSITAYGIPQKFFTEQEGSHSDQTKRELSPESPLEHSAQTRDRFVPEVPTPQDTAPLIRTTHTSAPPINQNIAGPTPMSTPYERPIEGTRVEVKKNKRRDSILALLQEKTELSIKDITNVIVDCSEKTIQRELVAMVNEGILKREGERRWSKYSLNN